VSVVRDAGDSEMEVFVAGSLSYWQRAEEVDWGVRSWKDSSDCRVSMGLPLFGLPLIGLPLFGLAVIGRFSISLPLISLPNHSRSLPDISGRMVASALSYRPIEKHQ